SRKEESVETGEPTRVEVPFFSREEESESLIDIGSRRENEPPVSNKEIVQPDKKEDSSLRSLARSSATSEPNTSENEIHRFDENDYVFQGESNELRDGMTEPMEPIEEEIPQDQEVEQLEAQIAEESNIESTEVKEES